MFWVPAVLALALVGLVAREYRKLNLIRKGFLDENLVRRS